MEILLPNNDDTRQLGFKIAKLILSDTNAQIILALTGPLGAGKTTLLQGLANGLGVKEHVNSPTFVVLNEYHSGNIPFFHFDLYRLGESKDQLEQQKTFFEMEIDEISTNKFVIAIEWAEYLADYLSEKDVLSLDIQYDQKNENLGRKVLLFGKGSKSRDLLDKLQSIYFC